MSDPVVETTAGKVRGYTSETIQVLRASPMAARQEGAIASCPRVRPRRGLGSVMPPTTAQPVLSQCAQRQPPSEWLRGSPSRRRRVRTASCLTSGRLRSETVVAGR